MDYHAWLKDKDEFPHLTSEQSWDDCRLYDDDDDVGLNTHTDDGNDADDDGDDADDKWQIINPIKTTYADILKRNARTNGIIIIQKQQANRMKPIDTTTTIQTCNNNNKMDTPDNDDVDDTSELHILRKSRSRRRYRGDHWIFQHRVNVLLRIGYGSSIQGEDEFRYHDPDALVPISDAPVDTFTFIRHWRYICKEDPEPEVDQLRKAKVKFLMTHTSE